MQLILQKICFSNVSGSFSNKDIGTALCFLAHKAKFFYCHVIALILNFYIGLKTHSEIRTCVSSLGIVNVIFVCQVWVWKKLHEEESGGHQIFAYLPNVHLHTITSEHLTSLTDLSSHHFRDNMKCNSHITVRKLRCGAPNTIFLTSNISSKGEAVQRSWNSEEVCLYIPDCLPTSAFGWNESDWEKKKAAEKIKLDKEIFPTKCSQGGG